MPGLQTWFIELGYLWSRRGTARALVVMLFALNTLLVPVIAARDSAPLWLIPLLNAGLIGSWLYWRRIPTGPTRIYFAAASGARDDSLVVELFRAFREEIQRKGLNTLLKCHLLHRHVVTNEEARDLLVDTHGRMVVYGSYQRGNHRGQAIEGFNRVHFTVRSPALNRSGAESVARTLASAVALRRFAFVDEESFIGRRLVAEQLAEVTSFFVATALVLDHHFDSAVPILRDLLAGIEARRQSRPTDVQLSLFQKSVTTILTTALLLRFDDIYYREIVDRITNRAADPSVRRAQQTLEEVARINRDDNSYLTTAAILSFHFGDVAKARRQIHNGMRVLERAHPAPYLSLAFLDLWEKKYESAIHHYMRAAESAAPDLPTAVSVVRFLESIVDMYPNRVDLRVGLAFVNETYFDRQLALKLYQSVLEATPNDTGIPYQFSRDRIQLLSEQTRSTVASRGMR